MSGRASRIALLEDLVTYMRRFRGRVVHDLRGSGALARGRAGGREGAAGRYPPGFGFEGSLARTRTATPLTSESDGSRTTASFGSRPDSTSTLPP